MGFDRADGEKQGTIRGRLQFTGGPSSDLHGIGLSPLRDGQDLAIANPGGVHGFMLEATENGSVTGSLEILGQVLSIIVQPKSSEARMGESIHSHTVWGLPRQQGGPAGRAGGRRGEGLTKEYAFLGQALQMGRRHGVAIGLNESPGIVAVEVKNIR